MSFEGALLFSDKPIYHQVTSGMKERMGHLPFRWDFPGLYGGFPWNNLQSCKIALIRTSQA